MKSEETIRVVWEYLVKEEETENFISVYSSDGEWAQLFKKYPGYIKTELIRETLNSQRFITIDYWASLDAYLSMQQKNKADYNVLDKKCQSYTTHENKIGIFQSLANNKRRNK